MQSIHFETIVKNGFIKIPGEYASLNDKKVSVEIMERKAMKNQNVGETREIKIKDFISKYKGLLLNTNIPRDIDAKKIRNLRINNKYGL
ncbi:MAG: hypothetical protein GTO45_12570 [Candidatus Aminicenantes bacterium]|nr:hypothetical protein [Candidatus Aminicenantes bacterium]NIM79621.1 hypothetical protein [Candidatus Aminicenantes bacterium]NIN18946.1 hypothetical protein [Candidatus Aminicenantes bacterium]NIN42849.1 hypothetical protein [Candidatus Aminicenantes bacterium]NIN85583.1 hypothetical protein [Candidatus Aminicenantes bacterium]